MNKLVEILTHRGDLSDLARRTGIDVSLLCGFRSGSRRPGKETARRIARVLGKPVMEIFPDYTEMVGK